MGAIYVNKPLKMSAFPAYVLFSHIQILFCIHSFLLKTARSCKELKNPEAVSTHSTSSSVLFKRNKQKGKLMLFMIPDSA